MNKKFAVTSFKIAYRKRKVEIYLTEIEIKSLFDSITNLKLKCALGLMYSARLSGIIGLFGGRKRVKLGEE